MNAVIPPSMDLQGCCELFKERIPTLQRLTSLKIARSLWYHLIFGEDFDESELMSDFLKEEYRNKIKQSSELLRDYIPHHLIPQLIKKSISEVRIRIHSWILNNNRNTLPDHRMIIFPDHFKCVVWRFNGEIDDTKTARKMLSLDSLSQVDKFAIMCRYCLEDEFENFTPNEELEGVLAKVISRRRPRLAFYWICKLKKDLRGMRFGANFESLESLMVTKCGHKDIHAVEYFWNRLSEQDQVAKAILLLNQRTWANPYRLFLSKMKEFQLGQILLEIPARIVKLFWNTHDLEETEIALSIWTRIKHFVSNEIFDKLLQSILFIASDRGDENFRLTIKLWDMACDHHKNFILDQEKNVIIKKYISNYFFSASRKLQLLYAMLFYSSPGYRKEFLSELGVQLMGQYHYLNDVNVAYPYLRTNVADNYLEADRVIKLCLPHDTEVIEFKKQMMESPEIIDLCRKEFSIGYFDNLNKSIEFYAPDVSAKNDFKKVILDSSEFRTEHIFLNGIWSEVEKFIDDAYPDALLAKNMKRRLILESGIHGLCDSMNANSLRSMINISTQFLTREEMVVMKESLLNEFRRKFMDWDLWKSFDETYWREFSYFCFDDGEKINEFKSTVPIDELFGQRLQKMISEYMYPKAVCVMDNFLKWCLVEPEKVKEYKLRRIYEFNDLEIIEKLIVKPYIKTLLVWFLDNDEEQISKFKTEFCDKNISQIL